MFRARRDFGAVGWAHGAKQSVVQGGSHNVRKHYSPAHTDGISARYIDMGHQQRRHEQGLERT
jgi:hypothetical protein